MPQKYALRAQEVEAIQLTVTNSKEVSKFVRGAELRFVTPDGRETAENGDYHRVAALVPIGTGKALAVEGDYIVRHAPRQFAVYSSAEFKQKYAKVVAPKTGQAEASAAK